MGFRFRKSIKLGGGFKINLSKSGVGYSWGTKGFRYTKKSTGGSRTTVSIPGTGISWSSDSKKKRKSNKNSVTYDVPSHEFTPTAQTYDTKSIENGVASDMVSDGLQDMLALASNVLKTYKWIRRGFWVALFFGIGYRFMLVVALALFVYSLYYKNSYAINLDYTIDDDMKETIEKRMGHFVKITECEKVWRIIESSKVVDKKYSSGASNLIKRTECKTSDKIKFPFKTSEKVASFIMGNESIIFLPDKLFIIQGNKFGALNYEDIEFEISGTRFIETEDVPGDAKIVDYTWEYVNKSGGPDKRFQNNKQIPVCNYGEIRMKSSSGLNTVLLFSNTNI